MCYLVRRRRVRSARAPCASCWARPPELRRLVRDVIPVRVVDNRLVQFAYSLADEKGEKKQIGRAHV